MRPGGVARAVAAALAVGALAACLPIPHALEGRACDDAHPCPGGLFCVAQVCRGEPGGGTDDGGPDAGSPANLVLNGGFEAGLSGWEPNSPATNIAEETQQVRSGTRAARVWRNPNDNTYYMGIVSSRELILGKPGMTYCATGWVKKQSLTGKITLVLRQIQNGTVLEDSGDLPDSSIAPVDEAWHRVRARLVFDAPHTYLTVRLRADTANGTEYYVDDVSVWEDPSGDCAVP